MGVAAVSWCGEEISSGKVLEMADNGGGTEAVDGVALCSCPELIRTEELRSGIGFGGEVDGDIALEIPG